MQESERKRMVQVTTLCKIINLVHTIDSLFIGRYLFVFVFIAYLRKMKIVFLNLAADYSRIPKSFGIARYFITHIINLPSFLNSKLLAAFSGLTVNLMKKQNEEGPSAKLILVQSKCLMLVLSKYCSKKDCPLMFSIFLR